MSSIMKEIKFAFYLIFHPFKGFNDMKYEGCGSARCALGILIFTVLSFIFEERYTAFTFNTANTDDFNIVITVFSVFLPYVLWCVSNWCFTSLMDGEGKFTDILMATAYALLPMALVKSALVVVSYFTTFEDVQLISSIASIATIWTVMLIIFGTLVVHQYSFGRTIFTSVLIVIGMAIIIFIALLFMSLFQQLFNFVFIIFREISLRL